MNDTTGRQTSHLCKLLLVIVVWLNLLAPSLVSANTPSLQTCISGAEKEVRKLDPSAINLASFSLRNPGGSPATVSDGVRNAKNVFLVYNLQGDICFQSHRRIKEGDILHVGVHSVLSKLKSSRRVVLRCNSESSELSLLDTLDIGIFRPDDTEQFSLEGTVDHTGLVWFTPQECFGEVVTFELRNANNAGDALFVKSVNQYKRFRGTFQLGAVWTELFDREYSRVTINDIETIQSDHSPGRGPLYMGSLVIYGLPHYLSSMGQHRPHYAGRDIVNENGWMDSIGLVLSLGLEDPAESFGIGLSYEFVHGVSLTLSYLSREVSILNGLSIGDPYPTSAGNIPTQNRWEHQTVLGLSVDGRYLTKFFGD